MFACVIRSLCLGARAHLIAATAVVTAVAVLLTPSNQARVRAAQQLTHTPMLGQTVKLNPAEAARKAAEERKGTPVQAGPGLEASVWAPLGMVSDPLAMDIDAAGVAYVVASPDPGSCSTSASIRPGSRSSTRSRRRRISGRSSGSGWRPS